MKAAASNGLCLAGVGLVTGALWLVHPALPLGWLGVLSITFGVWLHRTGGKR